MRRFVLAVLSLVLIGVSAMTGCGGSDGGSGSETYRTTTWYHFRTASTDLSAQFQIVMSATDLLNFENQTAIMQTAGTGFIFGSVDDIGTGAGIAGVTVVAINDAGVTAGTAIYRSTTGVFSTSLTSTSSNGDFIMFNVSPGRVNLRCTSGASGNIYVQSVADETTLVTLRATPTFTTVSWAGITKNHADVPGLSEPSVLITGVGTGAPFPVTSDSITGAFSAGTVPALQTYMVKLTKSGFVDTYNLFPVGSVALSSPAGDLYIVSTTDRDSTAFKPASVTLTAGQAIVRGVVAPVSGTLDAYTIACTTLSGTATGVIKYGDAATGAPSDALSATTSSGVFYVYNADPGTVFLSTTKGGFSGSTYVDTFADAITFLRGQMVTKANAPGPDTISVAGTLINFVGQAVANGVVERRGQGSSDTTNSFGVYSMTGVGSNHTFLLRTSRP